MRDTKQKEAAFCIILRATRLLRQNGRPRKLPGKPRAEAMAFGPSEVSYRSRYATKFSTSGAIKRAAFELTGFSKATTSRALHAVERAVVEAMCDGDHPWISIKEIDDFEADTRHIVRALNRASGKFLG